MKWKVPTPEPGAYTYPTADQVPPGMPPHPTITPGYPEVFTLWAFVFNYPELCSDPCDADDIGDTPARGGAYQLDGKIARGRTIHMRGRVKTGEAPVVGVALEAPRTAEVHVAMTSHGRAQTGDDLAAQLSIPVGSPAEWWPATFLAP